MLYIYEGMNESIFDHVLDTLFCISGVDNASCCISLPSDSVTVAVLLCRNLLSLQSFLDNRKKRTILNGRTSKWSSISAGIPQGSILGPFLSRGLL